jgi:hypothetical protein
MTAFGLLCALSIVTAWSKTAPSARGALLEGQVMNVILEHRTNFDDPETGVDSFPFVVGPGVELTDFGFREFSPPLPPLVDIDVSDRQILITAVNDQPFAFQEVLTFSLPNHPTGLFTRVNVNPATDWADFSSGRVIVSPKLINVVLSQLSGLEGQQILLDVIPEPSSGALLTAAGMAAAITARRGRR